jgi:putative membrane protein insertion efficiency factor
MITRALVGLIGLYKKFVSPRLPGRCRFHPTCADYAAKSLRRHGLLRGGALAAGRLARCSPLSEGGVDPVPEPRDHYLLKHVDWE